MSRIAIAVVVTLSVLSLGSCFPNRSTSHPQYEPSGTYATYQQPSGAVGSCSAQDQELVQNYALSAVDALNAGDMNRYLNLVQELVARLSPACRVQLQQQYSQSGNARLGSNGDGSVIDHGGGAYSVPGQGYCDSSGCIGF